MAKPLIKNATNRGLYMIGKHGAVVSGEVVQGMNQSFIKDAVMSAASFLGMGMGHVAMATMLGLGGAVSAAITQREYRTKCEEVKKDCSEELAVKLDKPVKAVSQSDLKALADGKPAAGVPANQVIGEHLDKMKRQRNWGVVFSVAATLASLAVVQGGINPAVFHKLGEGLGEILLKGLVGVLTYNVVKQPLHWLGDKLFKLEEETAYDRIVTIKRDRDEGKEITREQIAGVFASARPEIDTFVVAQYGAHFDELSVSAKQGAAEVLNQYLPQIDQLKETINKGVHNPMELAFAVQGDVSGVVHLPEKVEPKKPSMIGAMLGKMRHALHKPVAAHMEQAVAIASQGAQAAVAAVTHHDEAPKHSFVKQLGLTPSMADMSQLQRLQQRAQSTGGVARQEV